MYPVRTRKADRKVRNRLAHQRFQGRRRVGQHTRQHPGACVPVAARQDDRPFSAREAFSADSPTASTSAARPSAIPASTRHCCGSAGGSTTSTTHRRGRRNLRLRERSYPRPWCQGGAATDLRRQVPAARPTRPRAGSPARAGNTAIWRTSGVPTDHRPRRPGRGSRTLSR